MNDSLDPKTSQRLLHALRDARARLENYEAEKKEPIAVIGMGCRFPGDANDPNRFWQLMRDGVDAVVPIPEDRWDRESFYDARPVTPGKMIIRHGAFLSDIKGFDAQFFGISPREAMSMDPQHRMLLEVGWQALEHAGVPPLSLKNTNTGVYIGISQNDYAGNELRSGDLEAINAYSGTGNLVNFAPGRLAYFLGLLGPNMAVDTACSSSLTAIHLACSALRSRETEMALAGGVHLVIAPEICIFLSMARALSPNGRAKTFDASADGFSRGEGCGIVVLKRLSDARANGDRILGLIRGSAVNHDGPSSGLTVPSERAQEKLIREALKRSALEPNQINYVEAHGTGTSLGDPIEVNALGAALCENRTEPLIIGSLKTNVGHLETAAGVAGLIKVLLSMAHEEIPRNLHFQTPNPRIPWDQLPIKVASTAMPWPAGKKRFAGISSFGMNGTNAHIIVEDYAAEEQPPLAAHDVGTQLLTLSARTEKALACLVADFEGYLSEHSDENLLDICYTANTGRSHFEQRLGFLAASTAELREQLSAYRRGLITAGQFRGQDVRVDSKKALPQLSAASPKWAQLGEAYASGVPIDWQQMYRGVKARKLALPTYPFQHQPYWCQKSGSVKNRTSSLLGKRLELPFSEEVRFEACLGPQAPAHLADHQLLNKTVVSAASQIAMILEAAERLLGPVPCALESVDFSRALVLDSDATRTIQQIFSPSGEHAYRFRIISRADTQAKNADEIKHEWILHASGQLRSLEGTVPAAIEVDGGHISKTCTVLVEGDDFYARNRDAGYDFGPSFRWGSHFRYGEGEAWCRLERPASEEPIQCYRLFPGLLDSCFQLSNGFQHKTWDASQKEVFRVPVHLERLEYFAQPGDQELWCRVSSEMGSSEGRLLSDKGAVLAQFSGFRLMPAARENLFGQSAALKQEFYRTIWIESEVVSPQLDSPPSRWLLFGDATNIVERTAAQLQARGDSCVVVLSESSGQPTPYATRQIACLNKNSLQRLLNDIGPIDGVVHACALNLRGPEQALSGCSGVLDLVQAIANSSLSAMPRLWLLTQGLHRIGTGDTQIALEQSPLWGLAQIIDQELPDLKCTCIDLDAGANQVANAHHLIGALSNANGENRIAFRDGRRYLARIAPHQPRIPGRLSTARTLDALALEPMRRLTPKPDEVCIRVRAAGLNFKDVLNALGMLPPDQTAPPGIECSGVVVAVGEDVSHLKLGDEVLAALAVGCMADYITTRADLVVIKPAALGFEDAAAFSTVFLTAYYGLHHLAAMQAGERILIHAAAGGVGLAAVQLAQRRGLEVFASASPAKWDYLRSIGVTHVMNSRTMDFAQELMTLTEGCGVNIVLNSLSGEYIKKSFDVLGENGRFIEIGKIDIWSQDRAAAYRPDVTYAGFDLYQVRDEKPGLIPEMLKQLLDQWQRGELKTLPGKTFPLNEAADAFKYMARAKHIGKVVISMGLDFNGPELDSLSPRSGDAAAYPIQSSGCYLITGGLGALGLCTASWLVRRGARDLILLGRHAPSAAAAMAIEALEHSGCRVHTRVADIAVEEDVARLFHTIDAQHAPLRGIVHSAGVIDDATLLNQNAEKLARVFAPKVTGTWLLHRYSEHRALDFFVCFSSISALVGFPGQANYAAANAFMDALADYRYARGLPCLSIGWGPWSQVGMAADVSQDEKWRELGLPPIKPEHGLELFEKLLWDDAPRVGVSQMDWPKFKKACLGDKTFSLYALFEGHLRDDAAMPPAHPQPVQQQLLSRLRGVKPAARLAFITEHVRMGLAGILRCPPEQIKERDRLFDIGIDSLMAIELKNTLEKDFNIKLRPTLLFDFPSVEALVRYLLESQSEPTEHEESPSLANVPSASSDDIQALLAEMETISDDELDRMMQGRRGKRRG